MPDVSEVDRLMKELSNWERWGRNDERGTINYITPAKVLEAGALLRSGRVVSIGHDIVALPPEGNDPNAANPAVRSATLQVSSHMGFLDDRLSVRAHGFVLTHIDALSHVGFENRIWNDHSLDDVVSEVGAEVCDVTTMGEGIVTRGVFLDVAAARGVAQLEITDTVTPEDLVAAEKHSGTTVRSGDAVIVRTGVGIRVASQFEIENRLGLSPHCARWLDEKQVSVFGSDCPEKMPSGYAPKYVIPFHQVVMVKLGLALLDNVAVEPLATVCAEEGRNEFMFMVAPLRVQHATGSVVNPLALF